MNGAEEDRTSRKGEDGAGLEPPAPLPHTTRPRRLQIGLSLGVIFMAGVAYLTGASHLTAIAMALLGSGSLFLALRAIREERKTAAIIDRNVALSREEMAYLADS